MQREINSPVREICLPATDKEPPRLSEQRRDGGGGRGRGRDGRIGRDVRLDCNLSRATRSSIRHSNGTGFIGGRRALSDVFPPPPPPLIHFLSQNCTSDSASQADECRLASLHRRPHPISSSGTHCRVKWKLPTRAHRSLAIAAGPFARSISEGTVRRGKPRNEENDKRGVWERSAILPDDRRGAMKVINEIALLKSRPADTASSR